jgi:hypothetical protein
MKETNYLVHSATALSGALKPIRTRGEFRYDRKVLAVYMATACGTLRQLAKDHDLIVQIADSRSANAMPDNSHNA